jgi:hypothetical protein
MELDLLREMNERQLAATGQKALRPSIHSNWRSVQMAAPELQEIRRRSHREPLRPR